MINQSNRFKHAETLIRARLQQLLEERTELEKELHDLLNGSSMGSGSSALAALEFTLKPLTCAEAIDLVLSKSKVPLKTGEILAAFPTLPRPVQGAPKPPAVWAVLQRRGLEMHWQKVGDGRSTRWIKKGNS